MKTQSMVISLISLDFLVSLSGRYKREVFVNGVLNVNFWRRKYQELFNFQSDEDEVTTSMSLEMVDVVFLMNSDVKTLNFCSPTIEKVLYSNTTSLGKGRGWGGGGGGDGGEQMLKGIFLDSAKGG